jgi:DNA-binding transcriptional MerR regulator
VNFFIKNLILLVLLTIMIMLSKPIIADDTNTQTNTSGSNTNITGGYESTSETNYADGSTNTTTTNNDTTNTTTSNSTVPPPSANSPSYSSMSQDVCSMGVSGSVSTGLVGISGGKHFIDENCERIKLAKVLQDFGMKVASVAILCQDRRVHEAMQSAGTPCPFDGKIGKEAQAMWDKYPELRPDYENHLKRTEIMANVDAKLLAQQLKAEEEEAARIAAEEAKKAEKEALKKAEEEAKLNEELNNIVIHVDPDPVIVGRD